MEGASHRVSRGARPFTPVCEAPRSGGLLPLHPPGRAEAPRAGRSSANTVSLAKALSPSRHCPWLRRRSTGPRPLWLALPLSPPSHRPPAPRPLAGVRASPFGGPARGEGAPDPAPESAPIGSVRAPPLGCPSALGPRPSPAWPPGGVREEGRVPAHQRPEAPGPRLPHPRRRPRRGEGAPGGNGGGVGVCGGSVCQRRGLKKTGGGRGWKERWGSLRLRAQNREVVWRYGLGLENSEGSSSKPSLLSQDNDVLLHWAPVEEAGDSTQILFSKKVGFPRFPLLRLLFL